MKAWQMLQMKRSLLSRILKKNVLILGEAELREGTVIVCFSLLLRTENDSMLEKMT